MAKDPRKVINPETGRPIGEELLSPWDRRYVEPEIETPPSEAGGDTLDEPTPAVPRRTGKMVLQNIDKDTDIDEAAEAMRKALFGS